MGSLDMFGGSVNVNVPCLNLWAGRVVERVCKGMHQVRGRREIWDMVRPGPILAAMWV